MTNLETKAHLLDDKVMVDGQLRRLIKTGSRVNIVGGKLGEGEENATIKTIHSNFSGDSVTVTYLNDNETEEKNIKIK